MTTDRALIIIDMQREMQHRIDAGRPHVNPNAPAAVAALTVAFREAALPVIHVRHAEADPASPLHPDAVGYPAMPCAADLPGEPVFVKTTSSAFPGTGLEAYLRERRITDLYVVGAVAGFCVNSTVRSASDLGFAVTVVRDAVIGFDLPSAGLDAQTIFDVTMGLLAADFATLRDSAVVIGTLSSDPVRP
ncbi:isochorismatase family protein [Sphingomonas fuzhouensis]|uniref:isochorismatase family protein n=1 Tax=Sphingomonas fuzhouensis TaxID=3106033 RepID=UPI002AFEAD1B|nr:isochorismatase family protein [Sphingomonas sp. SGZ-02]